MFASSLNSLPAERRVFREEIRERMIDDILTERLPPGSRVMETRLAQRFGVSQAPVREAMRDLALFGFVVSSPFRGTQIREISRDVLLDIRPIRAAVEGVAAGAAASRIDESTLGQLEALIEAMRAAASGNDHEAHAHADFSFHQVIVKVSANRMAEHLWQTMRLAATTFTDSIAQLTRRSLREIGERHVPVLEAIRARDPGRAEAAMRKHIEEPRQWIQNTSERS